MCSSRPVSLRASRWRRSCRALDLVNRRAINRQNMVIVASVSLPASSISCAAISACRRRGLKSSASQLGVTAPSRTSWAQRSGWMSPRRRGSRPHDRTKLSRSSRASRFFSLGASGKARSQAKRVCRMAGSTPSIPSSVASSWDERPSSSAVSIRRRATTRAARPIRSSVSVAGSTDLRARNAAMIASAIGIPLSDAVAAASAAVSAARLSSRTGGCRPRCRCASTACSRRFVSRRPYSARAPGLMPICSARKATIGAGGVSPRRIARPRWRKKQS